MSWPIAHPDGSLTQTSPHVQARTSTSPIVWLLVGYMWLFVHRPFEIWPWFAAIRIERSYMIFTIICWMFSAPRLPRRNRLHGYLALFVAATAISWFLSPYQDVGEKTVIDLLKYSVFYVLLVTSVRNLRDLQTILAGYVGVMTLLMAHNVREYLCGREGFAQGIMRLAPVGGTFDTNDFAGLIVVSLPFVWVFWRQWTNRMIRPLLLGYLGLGSYCIMLTGSRMGLCGLLMAILLACLASPKRWRWLALAPVLLAVVWMVLPQDRKDRYLTIVDPSRGPTAATASAGHFRSSGFVRSLPLLQERPLFGYGPMGFGQATERGAMPHNLYGQLLAELGLAGAVAFGLVLWGVGQNTLQARRIVRATGAPASGGALARDAVSAMAASVLLLASMGWGFNFLFWHVWLWFGGFQAVALGCLEQQVAADEAEAFDMEPQPEILLTRFS